MDKTERYLEMGIPAHAIPKGGKRKKQSPANALTDEIISFLQSEGGAAYRVNSQGQFDPVKRTWRKSGMKAGLPDVVAVIGGRFLGVEIKIGSDRQSPDQKERQAEIIGAGGWYVVAKDFGAFKAWYEAFALPKLKPGKLGATKSGQFRTETGQGSTISQTTILVR